MNTANENSRRFACRYHLMFSFTLPTNQSTLRKVRSFRRARNRIAHHAVSSKFHFREARARASSASTRSRNRTITRASVLTQLAQLPPGGAEIQE
jgi:hypothetical protein